MIQYRKSSELSKKAWFAFKKDKPAEASSVVNFIAGWNAAMNIEVRVHEALSAALGSTLTEQNYEDWLWGGETYDIFDAAALQFLGQDAYDKLDRRARLDAYLRYRLGLGPKEAGGIVFKDLRTS